jgi:hypothetical protein
MGCTLRPVAADQPPRPRPPVRLPKTCGRCGSALRGVVCIGCDRSMLECTCAGTDEPATRH